MATKFHLRMGNGKYAYVSILRSTGGIEYASKDEGAVCQTSMTKAEWRHKYPQLVEKGNFEICKERQPQPTKSKHRKSLKKKLKAILGAE